MRRRVAARHGPLAETFDKSCGSGCRPGGALERPVAEAWQALEAMTVAHLSAGERAILRELLSKVRLGLEPRDASR